MFVTAARSAVTWLLTAAGPVGAEELPRKKGELYDRYERGRENQLGSLGLVLNCFLLWTTFYLDAAVRRLRAQG